MLLQFWFIIWSIQENIFYGVGFKTFTGAIMAFLDSCDVWFSSMCFIIMTPRRVKNINQLLQLLQKFDKLLSLRLFQKASKKVIAFQWFFLIYLVNLYAVDYLMWGFRNLESVFICSSYYSLHSIVMVFELLYWHLMLMVYYRIQTLNICMKQFLATTISKCLKTILNITGRLHYV